MKFKITLTAFVLFNLASLALYAQSGTKNLYIDVHHLGAGKVTYDAVAAAHKKDLAVEKKYHVQFIKFWVDERHGNVYCLSSAPDSSAIAETHREAHGLLPDQVLQVTPGMQAAIVKGKDFYLDIHNLGAGKVTAADVAGAHQKDLAVQDKHGVNFINYWVDQRSGTVVCLSQTPDSAAVIATHKEAHGLLPDQIMKVQPGQ
ncbi:MAG: DUF4242 domain-containing protein [Mucilaginibacter sp.]